MIAELKPYSKYQDSSSPWLGRFPAHWQLPRLGSVLRERGETNEARQVTQVLSVMKDIGVIRYEDKGNIGNKKSEDTARYKVVRPDDTVVNCMNVIIGSVGISRYTGCLSPVYYVFTRRFEADNPRYLNAVFQTKPFQLSLVRIGNGIMAHRMRIPMELLKCEPFPVPPPDEQAAIVRFLDHANRRIDRFIRAKKKMITLLNEQKQAIIHRAVTRGLDPNVPIKPSGIEWIGDIPEHWEVRRLKHCITVIEQGWSPQCDAQPAGDNEWGVLKVGCVNKDVFDGSKNKKLPSTLSADRSLEICKGDILVSRANTRELLGLAALAEKPRTKLILCDKLFRFRAMPNSFNSRFLVLSLRCKTSRVQIESSTNGASESMQNIGQGVIKNLWVSMPPVAEQENIVSYVTEEILPLAATISSTEREIALLLEYRTRLIADVVTGKLDVREAAKKLPEEAEQETLIEEADEAAEEGDEEMEGETA